MWIKIFLEYIFPEFALNKEPVQYSNVAWKCNNHLAVTGQLSVSHHHLHSIRLCNSEFRRFLRTANDMWSCYISLVTGKCLTWKWAGCNLLQDVNNGQQKWTVGLWPVLIIEKHLQGLIYINPLRWSRVVQTSHRVNSGSTKLCPVFLWFLHFVCHFWGSLP